MTLKKNYLFAEMTKEAKIYKDSHPNAKIISLGIGDVTLPLPKAVISAMKKATEELGVCATFRGYAPSGGYDFLRQAIEKRYSRWGCAFHTEEIFITDGAKSTLAAVVSLFENPKVLLPTPNYPVYMDLAKIYGFSVEEIKGNEKNSFLPLPFWAKKQGYLIFLCSPGNPTGVAYSREDLEVWVQFARETESLILFDAAYESFLGENAPRSIYQIPGARECAVEIGSFSKDVGFTGVRCGWVVFPKELKDCHGISLLERYERYIATANNGVSYITQRGAEAAFSPQGEKEVKENIRYYLRNAALLKQTLEATGQKVYGGEVSPYLWVNAGENAKEIWRRLLYSCQILTTPGAGFGTGGEGFLRYSAFGRREDIAEAAVRLREFSDFARENRPFP